MKVAALGDNCIDIYPDLDTYYCTGNVVDFGVNMQRLGIPVSVITTTGNDKYGEEMIRVLNSEGLDTSHLYVGDGPTAMSYMQLIDKERIYGDWLEGVMETVVFSEEDIAFAKEHDLVHSALWGNAQMHIKDIHDSGTLTSFDYADEYLDDGRDIFEETIEHVDYAFFSFDEDCEETRNFLEAAARRGPKMAIATFGEKGSLAWDGENYVEFGIFPSDLVNTIGAGDSYIAGFMTGILRGLDTIDCMKLGAKVAAQVVSTFGPWTER